MRLDRILLTSVALVSACASTPKGPYVAAKPEEPPKSMPPPQVTVKPEQLRPVPTTEPEKDKNVKPSTVIERANTAAIKRPDREGYFNAIMSYDYEAGALYSIYAAPFRITDIQLQPGERINGKPAAGDTTRWIMGLARSTEAGAETQHVYVKPTRPGIRTTLVLNTDRRTYHIELESYRETYMVAVHWNYPADEHLGEAVEAGAKPEAGAKDKSDKAVTANNVALDALNFAYRIEVVKGDPHFVPIQAFDDGRKTYLRFSSDMLVREAPALFVLSRNETQLVNYRVKNDTYVVDRLFDGAELRLGEKEQDIVRIVRTGGPAPAVVSAANSNTNDNSNANVTP